MKIINPTKDLITVQIKGTKYTIEAEGSLENIPEEIARYWQENLHKFLVLRKDKLEAVSVDEINIEKSEDVIVEEKIEETIEEELSPEVVEEDIPKVKEESKIKKGKK